MNIINHSFFTFFEPDVARAIARKADILTFVDGQIIFAEGDKQDGIYLVIEGAVAISKRDQNGHNTVIAHIYADDFFGEFAILDGRARSASVHAISPLIVVHLKTEDVAENLKSAKTNFELTNKIIGRIRVSNEKHANDYLQQERLIMLGKITSSIIENFRNPFTALYMFTEMVKKKSPELNPYCVIAQEQIDRMSGMADEILEFSSGDININKKKLNLSRLFDRFERLNNDYLSSLNIKLKIIPTKEFIHADENKILRVLQFLTTFSTRMLSKDGGVIQISTEKVNSRIHIRFEDNGPGIPKDTQKNIFKTFISNTQSDLRLDMTIVASIIEAHEGTIVVETDRAIGTSFLIKIPVNN